MADLNVPILKFPHADAMDLPAYATAQAAGLDLMAAIDQIIPINPGKRAIIPCGIAIALPDGFEAQVRPRSGLAARFGVTVLNSPGTIDADYRGEIKVILVNFGDLTFNVEPNARIAQLIITPVSRIQWVTTPDLPETQRGDGGFGSTGLRQVGE